MKIKINSGLMECIRKYNYELCYRRFLINFIINNNVDNKVVFDRISKEYEEFNFIFSALDSYMCKVYCINGHHLYNFTNDIIYTENDIEDNKHISDNTQYSDMIAQLFPEEIKSKLARTFTLQVTDSCNLACTYCYQIDKEQHMMTYETAKTAVDNILIHPNDKTKEYVSADDSQCIILEFIGGEPLLNIDLINDITKYFIEQMILLDHPWLCRFLLSMCSNGVLYFNENVQNYLLKYKDVLSFSISIDGNKKLHDSCRVFPDGSPSYDIAMAGVNHYRYVLNGYMGSKMTLAPENVMYTFDAIKGLIENGYHTINVNCIYENKWNDEDAKILYRELKKTADYIIENDLYDNFISIFDKQFFKPLIDNDDNNKNWCGGTGSMLAVDYKGDIFPCIRYMKSSLGTSTEPIMIGEINNGISCNDKYSDIVNMLNDITRRSQSTDECFNCSIAGGCAWCSAYNYQVFGTPNKRATFICKMHKARALANEYYWYKLYLYLNNDYDDINIDIQDNIALEIIDIDEWNMIKDIKEQHRKLVNNIIC